MCPPLAIYISSQMYVSKAVYQRSWSIKVQMKTYSHSRSCLFAATTELKSKIDTTSLKSKPQVKCHWSLPEGNESNE